MGNIFWFVLMSCADWNYIYPTHVTKYVTMKYGEKLHKFNETYITMEKMNYQFKFVERKIRWVRFCYVGDESCKSEKKKGAKETACDKLDCAGKKTTEQETLVLYVFNLNRQYIMCNYRFLLITIDIKSSLFISIHYLQLLLIVCTDLSWLFHVTAITRGVLSSITYIPF